MRFLKTTVALLLAVLWLPVTSHCLLETVGFVPQILCCEDPCAPGSETGRDAADHCESLESASYKIESDDALTVVPDFLAMVAATVLLPPAPPLSPPASASVATPPRSLPVTWQFVFRTALPPRAPSFVS